MTDSQLSCGHDQRRDAIRRSNFFGIDFLEVEPDHKTLTVTFLGKAPECITRENIRIDGGRRVTGIRVVDDPELQPAGDDGGDDRMVVRVDKQGDFSTYTLRMVEPGGQQPLSGFDRRYASIDFSFMADCPSELDCRTADACPPPSRPAPDINYLAKDYGSFRQLILDRLALTMPDWRERNPADVGIALVEILAYVGDQLSYYQDAVATEAYLNTARQRISVRRHARLVDYRIHEGCNARLWVQLDSSAPIELGRAQGLEFYMITRLPHASLGREAVLRDFELNGIDAATYEAFEVIDDSVHLNPDLRNVFFYTWGDFECCLPAGATRATLEGDNDTLGLKPGMFLLFEEVLGPKTGEPADADPAHRHVVRLTAVEPGVDALNGKKIIEIEWSRADGLPFALCLSALSGPPKCEPHEGVSVARGNIFLADHGRWRNGLDPVTVPLVDTRQHCECSGSVSDPVGLPGPFRPRLQFGPLTFAQPVPKNAPAAGLLLQDPRLCNPYLILRDSRQRQWTVAPDLLDSGPHDLQCVVEVDDEGLAHLRFGDDDLGQAPDPESNFTAAYRVGIGKTGMIAADSLRHIVFRNGFAGGLSVRNPLGAAGGIEPEPLADIKQYAPFTFRNKIRRAITPGDYATLAQAPYEPRVQRAEARFLWTGSWYEVAVAIDPFAEVPEEDFPALVKTVERDLYQYRRIGHDVKVSIARSVAIDLVLEICVKPDFLRGHVEAALVDAFSNRQLADGGTGFFYPDNLHLGEGIAVSRIIAAAQAVTGVYSVHVKKLNRKFEALGHALETGILRIEPWEMPRLDNDPSLPEHGTLKLSLRGGR
jgi:hypothetical protein